MYLLTVADECDAYFVKYKMHIEYAKSFCIFFSYPMSFWMQY